MAVRRHQSASVLVPALRTVGNIVTGDDLQVRILAPLGMPLSMSGTACCIWNM